MLNCLKKKTKVEYLFEINERKKYQNRSTSYFYTGERYISKAYFNSITSVRRFSCTRSDALQHIITGSIFSSVKLKMESCRVPGRLWSTIVSAHCAAAVRVLCWWTNRPPPCTELKHYRAFATLSVLTESCTNIARDTWSYCTMHSPDQLVSESEQNGCD